MYWKFKEIPPELLNKMEKSCQKGENLLCQESVVSMEMTLDVRKIDLGHFLNIIWCFSFKKKHKEVSRKIM